MNKNKKRGISHIEVIISFIIFVGFLVFFIYFLNPFEIKKLDEVLIDSLEREIRMNLSTNVTYFSIYVPDGNINTDTSDYDCFAIEKIYPSRVIVKDENGDNIPATISGGKLYIGALEGFYEIYFSENLQEVSYSLGDCKLLSEESYDTGLIVKKRFVSLRKAQNLFDAYIEDYESTKNNLNLPAKNNFAFILRTLDEELVKADKQKSEQISVLARDIPVEIIKQDAEILQGILNIQVW